jgi:hypothetical protein
MRAKLWLAWLATLSLACGSEAPRCKPMQRCDVREAACQEQALRQAACLRGRDESTDLSLPVSVMKREDYVQRQLESAAEENEPRAQMRRGLALFGLEHPDAERAAEQRARLVGAYYDRSERSITILDFGRSDSVFAVTTLVHEMVHALQDAAGELTPREPERRLDQSLAYAAISEGEATIVQDEALVLGFDLAFDEPTYTRALASYRRSSYSTASYDVSPFATAYMRFAYAFGASYLWPLRLEAGPAAFADAYDALPESTDAVMRGAPAHDRDDLGDSAVPVLSDLPDLPTLSLVGTYHLGRFLYEVGLDSYETRIPRDSLPAGDRFVADTLSVFVAEDGRVLAVYRARFASEDDLAELSDHLEREREDYERWPEREPPHGYVGIEGRDLWWAEAEWSLPSEAPSSELTWQAAPETDFGYDDDPAEPAAPRIHCLHARDSD